MGMTKHVKKYIKVSLKTKNGNILEYISTLDLRQIHPQVLCPFDGITFFVTSRIGIIQNQFSFQVCDYVLKIKGIFLLKPNCFKYIATFYDYRPYIYQWLQFSRQHQSHETESLAHFSRDFTRPGYCFLISKKATAIKNSMIKKAAVIKLS